MDYNFLICSLVWLSVWLDVGVSGAANKCSYSVVYGLFTAQCYYLDWDEMPETLNSNTEVLYAAKNRIRELKNSSLRNYPKLKMLYLAENFINKIEPGVFSETSKLEVLDMTYNAIRSLPNDLPLPLRTLYLARNKELPENLTLSSAYNLAVLSLGECQLQRVPKLGVLPNLQELNLTFNPLTSVTPADLAPLCRLKKLYLPATLFQHPGHECQCHQLLVWASQHYIQLPNFKCKALEVDPDIVGCNMTMSEELMAYKMCLNTEPPPTPARYMLMAAVAGSVLVALLIIICCWRKRRRKRNTVEAQRVHKNTKALDTLIM